jgi:four helix bundle protein
VRSTVRDRELAAYEDTSEKVRAWGLQLRTEDPDQYIHSKAAESRAPSKLIGSTPIERLAVASSALRLGPGASIDALRRVVASEEDSNDHNLPLMYWYALEPLAGQQPAKAFEIALTARLPQILPLMSRRIASDGKPESIQLLIDSIGRTRGDEQVIAVLNGLNAALRGQRNVASPAAWPEAFKKLLASSNERIRSQARTLGATFGDAATLAVLRDIVANASTSVAEREQAIDALVKARDLKLPAVLRQVLESSELRGAAIRALAAFEDEAAPAAILAGYRDLAANEKRDALATLSSRKSYALALLDAIAEETVPSGDLPADLARQIKNLKDEKVTARLSEVWGSVSDQSADAKAEVARWTAILTNKPPRPEEASHGRAVFAKTCAQCHTLFGEGGKVGPDLTGSNRANLEYVLSNVLEPSAVMAKEYQTSTVTLADGRVITGIIKAQDKQTVTVQTPNELLTYPRSDIEDIQTAAISMMPIELVKPLSEDDVRALVAYLASPKQVSFPEGGEGETGRGGEQRSKVIHNSGHSLRSSDMRIERHTDLHVYRKAFDVAMKVFELSRQFPKDEAYSLTDQIRRSSRSVCANIAEAWRKRRYEAAFVSNLSDSETEAAETQVWLEFAVKCGYLAVR